MRLVIQGVGTLAGSTVDQAHQRTTFLNCHWPREGQSGRARYHTYEATPLVRRKLGWNHADYVNNQRPFDCFWQSKGRFLLPQRRDFTWLKLLL